MALVNEENVVIYDVSMSETGVSLSETGVSLSKTDGSLSKTDVSLSDMLVKVLKTMKDSGVISDEENDKTKMVDVVHRVICNRENEWGENDTEEILMQDIISEFYD